MIETHGLTHIQIVVADLQRSLVFYERVFGMEEQYRSGPTMVFLRTPGAYDTITINEDAERSDDAGRRDGVDHFGFRLKDPDDLERAIAEVEAAGGKLVERGNHGPGIPYAYVSDPDGYLIEL
jgi:catechol 2,3-dioxygenase-like lactoylglutathione lyase family enzyme